MPRMNSQQQHLRCSVLLLQPSAIAPSLEKLTVKITTGRRLIDTLIESGNSESFIHANYVNQLHLVPPAASGKVSMEFTELSCRIKEIVEPDFA